MNSGAKTFCVSQTLPVTAHCVDASFFAYWYSFFAPLAGDFGELVIR